MNPTPAAVIGDRQIMDSPTVVLAAPASRTSHPATSGGRGSSAGHAPAALSFDDTREYFPTERRRSAVRPPVDAPTMAEAVAAIALGVAA